MSIPLDYDVTGIFDDLSIEQREEKALSAVQPKQPILPIPLDDYFHYTDYNHQNEWGNILPHQKYK